MPWGLFGKPAETPSQRQQREYRELVEKTQREGNEARAKGLVQVEEEVDGSYVGGQHNGDYTGIGYRKVWVTPEERNRRMKGKNNTKRSEQGTRIQGYIESLKKVSSEALPNLDYVSRTLKSFEVLRDSDFLEIAPSLSRACTDCEKSLSEIKTLCAGITAVKSPMRGGKRVTKKRNTRRH